MRLAAPRSHRRSATGGGAASHEIRRIDLEADRGVPKSSQVSKNVPRLGQDAIVIRPGYRDRQKAEREAERAQKVHMAQEKAKKVRRPSAERDHIRGNPKATISLIEYSDFECPYCKRFHDTPKQLLAAHGDEINWVYRYFPLSFHNPGAETESQAAECAAELGGADAFWRYTDALYARTTSGGKGFAADKLTPLATELGLDGPAFQQCLDSGRHADRVAEDLKEGASIGITGTPGNILLNNETGEVRLLSGALPKSAFDAGIAELLAKPVAANAPSQ